MKDIHAGVVFRKFRSYLLIEPVYYNDKNGKNGKLLL